LSPQIKSTEWRFGAYAQVLWTTDIFGGYDAARKSPDGRHLEIQTWTATSNMWMMENF
jgi:hypothetical protein